MNLRQLECFLAVADELHFARAADRLHLSPASVSEAIAALERRVGGPLFDRSSRRVSLTAHGLRFLGDVREPFTSLARAHENARTRALGSSDLVVAHTPELGQLMFPPLLSASWRRRLPGLRWRPVLMHTPQQMAALEDGRADLGLCWSAATRSPLNTVVLGQVPIVAILRAEDPLATAKEVPLSALRTRSLLMTPRSDNPFVDSVIHTELVHAGVSTANVEEVGRFDELTVRVAAGQRIGLHPATITATNRVPDVVFRPIAKPGIRVTICLVHREDRATAVEPLLTALREIGDGLGLGAAHPGFSAGLTSFVS